MCDAFENPQFKRGPPARVLDPITAAVKRRWACKHRAEKRPLSYPALRLLDHIKSNLIATVSHELKTPVTSLQMALHVLLEETVGSINTHQKEMLTIAWLGKDGGRLAISDVVMLGPLPESLANDMTALTGCVSGAASADTVRDLLRGAGFENVRVDVRTESREFIRDWLPGSGVENYVASATIEAVKPGGKSCCGPSCCA